MRVVVAAAISLFFVGAAYAQTTPPEAAQQGPTVAQAQTPAADASPSGDSSNSQGITVTGVQDRDHEMICHTVMATGSRLSGRGHGTRVCKTRQQWDAELGDTQRRVELNSGSREYQVPSGAIPDGTAGPR